MSARVGVGEHDFVTIPIHRPEVGRLHLSLRLATRSDRRLVHGQDFAAEHRCALRQVDRLEQRDRAQRPVRERRTAHVDTRCFHALMLAIERKVIAELVDQHACQQAHVGVALLEHRGWCGWAGDLAGVPALDHLPHDLDDLVRGRLLRQAVRDAFLDHDLVAVGHANEFGVGDLDPNDRNRAVEAKTGVGAFITLRWFAARIATDLRGRNTLGLLLPERLTEVELQRVRNKVDAALRLCAEELLLEPAKLLFGLLQAGVELKTLFALTSGDAIGVEHQLDQLFAARLREIFLRHTSFLFHLVSPANRNPIQNEAKCFFRKF